MMQIRRATIDDSEAIAALLLSAMEDLVYKFLGERSYEKAVEFVLRFVKMDNTQHSWRNCFVGEENKEVVTAVSIYDGSRLKELRQPMIDYAQEHLDKDFHPEDETQAGEYYIDSLGVSPNQQGKGYGTTILEFLIEEYVSKRQQTLGLLVDEDNPSAKKLYLKLGFKVVGKKKLAGKPMEHLQIG